MKNNGKIFVEAEGFKDYGGWSLDSQFSESMGSSYLLAHCLGVPLRCRISTHTPHAGRDGVVADPEKEVEYFNSHAPCGA